MTPISSGFPPIARQDARILILGTLPGTESLKQQQYYAHPQNHFWRIMAALTGTDSHMSYHERTQSLMQAGIALWDVCAAAQRAGSLDSAIRSPTPNDFAAFFALHTEIDLIAFNGRAAENLFRRHATQLLPQAKAALPLITLPSTSPAFAAMRMPQKLTLWAQALQSRISGTSP